MINSKNVLTLLEKAFNDSRYDIESIITIEEKQFSLELETLIKDAINDNLFIETYDTLNFDEESVISDACAIEEEFEDDYNVINNLESSKKVLVLIDLDYKTNVVNFWRSGCKGRLKLTTVKHRFRKVNNVKTLYRWEKQISQGGTRLDKLLKISEYVLEQFQNAREKSLPVHDLDINRWAIKSTDDVGLSNELFTASSKWIYTFKQQHRIVSRKINKFVTTSSSKNKVALSEETSRFTNKVKFEISQIGRDNIYNTDQSGFNLEMRAGRTLSFKGTLKIESLAQSLDSLKLQDSTFCICKWSFKIPFTYSNTRKKRLFRTISRKKFIQSRKYYCVCFNIWKINFILNN